MSKHFARMSSAFPKLWRNHVKNFVFYQLHCSDYNEYNEVMESNFTHPFSWDEWPDWTKSTFWWNYEHDVVTFVWCLKVYSFLRWGVVRFFTRFVLTKRFSPEICSQGNQLYGGSFVHIAIQEVQNIWRWWQTKTLHYNSHRNPLCQIVITCRPQVNVPFERLVDWPARGEMLLLPFVIYSSRLEGITCTVVSALWASLSSSWSVSFTTNWDGSSMWSRRKCDHLFFQEPPR